MIIEYGKDYDVKTQNLEPYFKMMHEVLANIAHDFSDLSYYQGMNYVSAFLWHTVRGTHPNLDPLGKHIRDSKLQKTAAETEIIDENLPEMAQTPQIHPEFSPKLTFALPENFQHKIFCPDLLRTENSIDDAKQMTYKFLYYMCNRFLNSNFHSGFQNLFKLLFMSDKILQHSLALTFSKLHRGKVTSILFYVSSLLTLFSSAMKVGCNWQSIYRLWDLVLGGGYSAVYKFLIKSLELQ